MKKFKSMLKPKPNPSEQLKDWQRRLRQESRNIERQIRGNDLTLCVCVCVKVSIFIGGVGFFSFVGEMGLCVFGDHFGL